MVAYPPASRPTAAGPPPDRSALARALDDPRVVAGWLFGSQATGRAHPASDVDVAVLLTPAAAAAPRTRLLLDLLARLGTVDPRVDLVVLNEAPNALAFRVLRDGHLLVDRDETATRLFTVATWREHGDREHVERFFDRVVKARLAAKARRG